MTLRMTVRIFYYKNTQFEKSNTVQFYLESDKRYEDSYYNNNNKDQKNETGGSEISPPYKKLILTMEEKESFQQIALQLDGHIQNKGGPPETPRRQPRGPTRCVCRAGGACQGKEPIGSIHQHPLTEELPREQKASHRREVHLINYCSSV